MFPLTLDYKKKETNWSAVQKLVLRGFVKLHEWDSRTPSTMLSLCPSPHVAFVCTSVQVVLSFHNCQPHSLTDTQTHTFLNLQHPRYVVKKLGFECRVFPKWFVIDPTFTLQEKKRWALVLLFLKQNNNGTKKVRLSDPDPLGILK